MEIITKTAQVILNLLALITCICKPWLIRVYSYNMYQLCVFFRNKQSIYLSTLNIYVHIKQNVLNTCSWYNMDHWHGNYIQILTNNVGCRYVQYCNDLKTSFSKEEPLTTSRISIRLLYWTQDLVRPKIIETI